MRIHVNKYFLLTPAYEIFRYFREIVKMNFKNTNYYEPLELFLEDNQENI